MKYDLPKEFESTIKSACKGFEEATHIPITPKTLIDLAFISLAEKDESFYIELARRDFLSKLRTPFKATSPKKAEAKASTTEDE